MRCSWMSRTRTRSRRCNRRSSIPTPEDRVRRLPPPAVIQGACLPRRRRRACEGLGAVAAGFKAAVDALFDRSEDVVGSFFGRYPELKPLYDAYVASAAPVPEKRRQLLADFQPELSRRRKRQQALQARERGGWRRPAVHADAARSPGTAVPASRSRDIQTQPALNDILAVRTQGLAAQFFFRNTATGTVDLEDPAVDDP